MASLMSGSVQVTCSGICPEAVCMLQDMCDAV